MGCGAGKVTPAESIHSDNKTAAPHRENGTMSNQDTEETDGPQETVPVSSQPQSKMYHRPQLHPKQVPLLNPFETDKVELSAICPPKSRNKPIKSPSPFLIPTPNLRPASPFITGNLKNYREASTSQLDFLKMLDKKIAEGVDYIEK